MCWDKNVKKNTKGADNKTAGRPAARGSSDKDTFKTGSAIMIGYIKEAFSKAGEHVDRKSNMAAGIRKMINPMKMPNNSGKREAKNAKSLLIRKA